MNDRLITLDVDWAPDFAIEEVARQLVARGVRATWFVTHQSPAVKRLAQEPLFELGIHPNFMPGSTHGETIAEVISHCMELVPTARSLRTHGLVQSTGLLDVLLRETPLDIDLSLFLPRATHLQPVVYPWAGRVLCRLPYFWEDDFEMLRPDPGWDIAALRSLGPGLQIFNFHPIHLVLNSATMERYEDLKARVPNLTEARLADVETLRHDGEGAATVFGRLLDDLASSGESLRVSDLADRFRAEATREA